MDTLNEKHNIKNLLFTKAIPNYVIPVPVNGHKVYGCTDCGDKFVFESSYNYHISRKSVKISYMCRHCNQMKVFFNRCNLLFHIRSHAFKTATINVSDLKIEPLPMCEMKSNLVNANKAKQTTTLDTSKKMNLINCTECKENITVTGVAYKDRASHMMQFTNEVQSCPVCLFALPSICGLKTHLRLHLKFPPYYCPECGSQLSNKNINYPYNHDCEGFKMMRATARVKCVVPDCCSFHPNDYKEHMKENHLKKVFKCPICVVACFNEATMRKHLDGHNLSNEAKPLIFYQCEGCPGRFVMQNHMDQHLKSHVIHNNTAFPCWACNTSFKEVSLLLNHHIKEHNHNNLITSAIETVLKEKGVQQNSKSKRIYRVVKKCDQCQRSFTYRCNYNEIGVLPNECPYKCSSSLQSNITADSTQNTNSQLCIKCHLCGSNISHDWEIIKKHYAEKHKTFRCLDPEILIKKIDVTKYLARNKNKKSKNNNRTLTKKVSKRTAKRQRMTLAASSVEVDVLITPTENSDLTCNICNESFDSKDLLEGHIISHRDPCMAYQCMECGQSFVVKPSFSKHLLLEHSISNTEEYISNKQCYNENALLKYQDRGITSNEPLGENQCSICREQFNDAEELEKHFRVHGMAFLKKNTSTKNQSP